MNEKDSIQDGLIYIERGGYKKEFYYNYNSTSETEPVYENIIKTEHVDVELGT